MKYFYFILLILLISFLFIFSNLNSDIISLDLFCNLLNKFGIYRKDLRWCIDLNINYRLINKKKLFNYWIDNMNLEFSKARPRWLKYTGSTNGRLTDLTTRYGCINLAFASVVFRNFFLNFINTFFEKVIRMKNKKVLGLILKGYFAGDGHVAFKLKPRRKNISFGIKDKKLLLMLKKSLRIVGLHSVKETYPEKTKINSKSICIYNLADFRILDLYDIPNLVSYKRKKFTMLLKSY